MNDNKFLKLTTELNHTIYVAVDKILAIKEYPIKKERRKNEYEQRVNTMLIFDMCNDTEVFNVQDSVEDIIKFLDIINETKTYPESLEQKREYAKRKREYAEQTIRKNLPHDCWECSCFDSYNKVCKGLDRRTDGKIDDCPLPEVMGELLNCLLPK